MQNPNHNLRFVDVDQEKGTLLNIIDIMNIPLVSLSESCQFIESIVPNIQDHVDVAYMWADSLDSIPHNSTLENAAGYYYYDYYSVILLDLSSWEG